MIVTPEQFAEDVFDMLKKSVAEEYKDATEEEREQALGKILDAWSKEMFMGPKEDDKANRQK